MKLPNRGEYSEADPMLTYLSVTNPKSLMIPNDLETYPLGSLKQHRPTRFVLLESLF